MSRQIWKFELRHQTDVIQVPKGGTIRHLAVQGPEEDINLWIEVTPGAALEPRRFGVFTTGHDLPEIYTNYIGSVMLQAGMFVFHVYELPVEITTT